MNGNSIIVTGGSGFIGSALVRHAIQYGHYRVTNIDKLTYAGNPASLRSVEASENYRFVREDIVNTSVLSDVFQEVKPRFVFHLAAESHVDRSIDGPRAFIDTNVIGTYSVLDAARRYWEGLSTVNKRQFKLVHVSTDEVYGSLGDEGLFTEETSYSPRSPYSATKAASDHLARAWFHTFGFPAVVTNCSNNYGPYQFPEKLIPLVCLNALEGRDLPIYGKGDQVRDWLHVEDHVRALILAAEKGEAGRTYNVGGNNEKQNIEVVETICDVLDRLDPKEESRRDLICFVKDRPGHDKRYAIDASRISEELGWKPKFDFASGIEDTIKWYLNNEPWWRPIRENVYQGDRLGGK